MRTPDPDARLRMPVTDKPLYRRIGNRIFHLLARFCPGSMTFRPMMHRLRGVKVGANVLIGEDVYIDNEYPESVEIGDNVQISIRAIIIAHTRGPGKVIIGKNAFVGPNSVLICGAGRVLKIGEGAVIGAGSIVNRSIPPKLYVAPAGPQPLGRANIPLPLSVSMEEFWSGLELLDKRKNSK